MFSFDLHNVKSTDVYQRIDEDVKKQFPDSAKILNTTHVLVSGQTLANVSDYLKAILDNHVGEKNHEYYVVQMAQSGKGWLYKSKWDLLNRILAKVAIYC